MFLGWIGQLNFLAPNPESGIFLGFPKPIRRDLASQVVTHLLSDELAFSTLTSRQHVTVTLELLGQAFGLDIADEKIISQVTELYRKWLLTDNKPTPMRDDVEHYIVEMMKHFSLLFTPRPTGNSLTHAKLCTVVLEVIEQLGKDFATLLSVQTWEAVLKIVLGICDHLFRLPEVESELASGLCATLFRVTMSLWVRSTTQSSEMWDIFKTLVANWRHRKPIILQWISTCTSFTHSILSLLYVFPAPKTTVIFQHMNTNDTVQLEQGLVFFFWFRLLHLLGDLDTIESPDIYLEAIKGVHQLAKLFYLNMDIKNVKLLPPDGNGILHIFAPFLLDAINIERAGYNEGRAEALHTLLQICTHKPTTEYDPAYLAALYRGIQTGIDHNLMLDIVIRTSERLFTHNFKGIRLLVPTYWKAIKKALMDPGLARMEGLVTPKEDLRHCCYRIASFLLTFANIYGDQTFEQVCPGAALFDAAPTTKFSELLSLRTLLVTSLLTETTQANLILLINIIFNSVWEDSTSMPDFPTKLVVDTLGPKRKTWTPEVNSALLQAWTDLSQLYPTIHIANPTIGDDLMTKLTELLDELFRQKSEPTATQDLIILTYRCINAWIMKGQWILSSQTNRPRDRTTLYKVLSYVFLGMTGRWGVVPGMAPHDPVSNPAMFNPSEDVQNAAKSTLLLLVNRIDHFPGIGDSSIISSQKTELDVLNTNSSCTRAVGVYILDDRIVTVIRHPRDDDGNFITTLFIRDASGRYCWNTTLLFDPLPERSDYPKAEAIQMAAEPAPLPVDEKMQQSLFSFLSEEEKARYGRLLPRLNGLVSQETTKLSAVGYHLNTEISVNAPELPKVDLDHDTTASRLLLSHLGWNDANHRLRFFFVKDITAASTAEEDLRVLFSEIDSLQERSQYTASIFHVSGTFPTYNALFTETSPSPAFTAFVQELGNEVELTSHHGFVGGLHPDVTGPTALYFANADLEVVYHVAPKMPYASLTEQQYKRRLLLENKVAILWMETASHPFKPFDFIKDSLAHTILAITPLSPQLFRIQIFKRPDPSLTPTQLASITNPIGPLMSEFIVSRHTLASLVRTTTLNALSAHSQSERPQVIRQKAINEFIKKHKNDKALVQVYYCQQFA